MSIEDRIAVLPKRHHEEVRALVETARVMGYAQRCAEVRAALGVLGIALQSDVDDALDALEDAR